MPIPFEILPTVDSTSSEAMRRLQAGATAPFAIAADVQTAGRGRRGRQWLGQQGNLYLTLAVSGEQTPPRELATWPVRFAALVCEVLRQRYGLTASLKWPNDIYVNGAKLGGVLGESVMQGDAVTAIVIGLGLNVTHIPAEPIEGDAVCLAQLRQPKVTASLLGQWIVDAFAETWPQFRSAPLASLWENFGLLNGQIWGIPGNPPKPELLSTAYDADGGLELIRLDDDKPVRFVSADHEQRWLYDARHRDQLPFVALDIGNTQAKLTRFDNTAADTAIVDIDANSDWQRLLSELPRGWPIFYVSVNQPYCLKVCAALANLGFRPIKVPKRPVRVRPGNYDFAQLGIDRLAAMEGFLAGYEGTAAAAVIISAGTAMTIDILTLPGHHLGGYIMPGLAMGLTAMHEHTDQLPLPALTSDLPRETTDTASAMLGGMRLTLQGAAALVVAELQSKLAEGAEITCVATGGGAATLFPAWADSTLIARGVRAIVYR